MEEVRDRHPKPYMRERAAALLRIARGESPHQVARRGLLKARHPDTVYAWLDGYEQKGLSGLERTPRKAQSFPSKQVAQLKEMLRQAPPALATKAPAPPPTRWSLNYLRQAVDWLSDYSLSGIWRLLDRLEIRYCRGRQALHSPDPDYERKRDYAQACVDEAWQNPKETVALYLDELSFYRQPTLACCYWHKSWGSDQPLARLSQRSNTGRRIAGALDAVRGRVLTIEGSKIGVRKLVKFYQQIRASYPWAKKIYLIQDNWPVHFHPDVQAAAQEARIEMVRLPTYAPWLNPIEKLWRWLKQDVLHMHRLSDRWDQLLDRVRQFLKQFQTSRPQRKSNGYFLGYFSINQAQFGAGIIGFRCGQFGAEMLEGGIIARGAQTVNLDRERLGL